MKIDVKLVSLCRRFGLFGLLEKLGERAIGEHGLDNVETANKLTIDVELRNGRPIRIRLDERCVESLRKYEHVVIVFFSP
jgi:hypothetical protein